VADCEQLTAPLTCLLSAVRSRRRAGLHSGMSFQLAGLSPRRWAGPTSGAAASQTGRGSWSGTHFLQASLQAATCVRMSSARTPVRVHLNASRHRAGRCRQRGACCWDCLCVPHSVLAVIMQTSGTGRASCGSANRKCSCTCAGEWQLCQSSPGDNALHQVAAPPADSAQCVRLTCEEIGVSSGRQQVPPQRAPQRPGRRFQQRVCCFQQRVFQLWTAHALAAWLCGATTFHQFPLRALHDRICLYMLTSFVYCRLLLVWRWLPLATCRTLGCRRSGSRGSWIWHR
jgi:hypothetical protein